MHFILILSFFFSSLPFLFVIDLQSSFYFINLHLQFFVILSTVLLLIWCLLLSASPFYCFPPPYFTPLSEPLLFDPLLRSNALNTTAILLLLPLPRKKEIKQPRNNVGHGSGLEAQWPPYVVCLLPRQPFPRIPKDAGVDHILAEPWHRLFRLRWIAHSRWTRM